MGAPTTPLNGHKVKHKPYLTGGSYWPKTDASELHFAISFQGHPTWPYLAHPNMHIWNFFTLQIITGTRFLLLTLEHIVSVFCLEKVSTLSSVLSVFGGLFHVSFLAFTGCHISAWFIWVYPKVGDTPSSSSFAYIGRHLERGVCKSAFCRNSFVQISLSIFTKKRTMSFVALCRKCSLWIARASKKLFWTFDF